MAFRSVGTNLSRPYTDGVSGLAEDLEALKSAGPDFVEVWPQNLGVILGGSLDANRLRTVGELLLEAELAYTVHAPLEVNLMDLSTHGLQRDVLNSSSGSRRASAPRWWSATPANAWQRATRGIAWRISSPPNGPLCGRREIWRESSA